MTLAERLNQDLTKYQSIPFWSWNDELDPQELRRQIRAMKAAGIGGFFMHARGGLMTEYMGDKWFAAVNACADEAAKQHMVAWCYDENGWPSGFAGMKLLADEKNWGHYLTYEQIERFDEAALAVYRLADGDLVRVLAPGAGGGPFHCLYDRTNSSVVDILNPEIVDQFIKLTHEQYRARCGEAFGRALTGFFTDEPQYFRYATAYSPVARAQYEARYGGDLLDELGALFVDCRQARRLRFRYWRLMNELFTETFAGRIYAWCEAHSCRLTGHAVEESSLFGQMMCCAGAMPFYEYEHIPGIDWLGRFIADELSPRQVSSAAQQLGKKQVLTETFACAGWDVTPRELSRIAQWQYVNGVNLMCQHLYPYSIRGQRKRDYPAFYSEHNPWNAYFKRFNDYFTVLGYLLCESREVADVAVIHPIHSAYFTFHREDERSTQALDARFHVLIERLGAAGVGHHFVDERLLEKHGSVAGDRLCMGQCQYHYVVLPEMEGLDRSTARLLREFLQGGGRLYMQGKPPEYVDGERADLSFLQANATFEDLLSADARLADQDSPIRLTLRRSEFGDFLYAVNLSGDQRCANECRLRARGCRGFDLQAHAFYALSFAKDGPDFVRVPIDLRPGQSVVIFLDDAAQPAATVPAPARAAIRLPLAAEIAQMDENTLTLDYASLSYDGVCYEAPQHVMALSDRLLRARRNGRIYLKYTFAVREIPASLRVEAERMNAAQVLFNGRPLSLDGPGSFDRAFASASLNELRLGENELVFAIDYRQPDNVYQVFNGVYYEHSDGTETLINCLSYETDIEAVYLRGRFAAEGGPYRDAGRARIAPGPFAVARAQSRVRLDALPEAGYPFFAGRATFEIAFEAEGGERTLIVGGRWAVAEVQINGGPVQTLLFDDRCRVELRPGRNALRLTLISSYRNVFGPFHVADDPEPLAVDPLTFTRYGQWRDGQCENFRDSYAFTRFGVDELILE